MSNADIDAFGRGIVGLIVLMLFLAAVWGIKALFSWVFSLFKRKP